MACKVYESTKLFNSKSKQKQIRPTRIQLRKRHRTISFTESDPLCLYTDTGDTDTNMELTPFKPEPTAEPVNPRDPLNLNSLHNNKKKKKIGNNNNNIKGKHILYGLFICIMFLYLEREEMETCKHKQTYVYGNYPCYYGYRMECSRDPRLDLFTSDMFHNKKCLDIGCNSGAITIKIARDFTPLFIEGVDLDPELIKRANKNVRYSLGGVSSGFTDSTTKQEIGMFPQNISFKTHNYVLPSDEMLERYVPEISYDVILCLSVTKWVQLNWGDDGVKRLFTRSVVVVVYL